MPKESMLSIRLESEIKKEAEAVYANFGISLGDAVNIFIHKSIMEGGLPFDMKLPRLKAEVIEDLRVGHSMLMNQVGPVYSSAEEAMASIFSEDDTQED